MQRPINKSDLKHSRVVMKSRVKYTIVERPKGAGDSVKNFLHSGLVGKIVHRITGLDEPCGECKKRQDKLNKLIPYDYDFEVSP